MGITLEQVEKLRDKANVSYNDAKEALEATDGDLLEALIYLEKKGKVTPPEGGGYYKSKADSSESKDSSKEEGSKTNRNSFADLARKFVRYCGKLIHKGNINYLVIKKDGEVKTKFPATLLVIMLLFFFWVTMPLLIIGLFFGFRYSFCGPDLGKEFVNEAMDNIADTAENIKKSFTEEVNEEKNECEDTAD
ncbi:MAG: DUF4342 domain-containing protein [Clostridiales bacterium]|nr:DUF4342 domain-containing protein [Clostridiales bacterium]